MNPMTIALVAASEDQAILEALARHLHPLVDAKLCVLHRIDLAAPAPSQPRVDRYLVLVSADLLAAGALPMDGDPHVPVWWVLARPCAVQFSRFAEVAPLLPVEAGALSCLPDCPREEALTAIAEALAEAVGKRPTRPRPPSVCTV